MDNWTHGAASSHITAPVSLHPVAYTRLATTHFLPEHTVRASGSKRNCIWSVKNHAPAVHNFLADFQGLSPINPFTTYPVKALHFAILV